MKLFSLKLNTLIENTEKLPHKTKCQNHLSQWSKLTTTI